ncbi:hypothetical protein [Streptomyces sp. CB03238]|uniref:hypothetical protein n=1 Tax=Streptomyces sp. CB03238 TaxID=1907777 RepID=UPI000A103443|nr:hypothetical protein [Streptomyces sp. CB03238]ORT61932.1 hypothetical protein BKD26_02685 [Streptomyces sp. CB03238]
MSVTMPDPIQVGEVAARIHTAFEADPEFDAFKTAVLTYNKDWPCYSGFAVISEWDITRDGEPLFIEGLRALVLKSAVYELVQDEKAAEIALPNPVDDVTHAMLAQPQMLKRITDRQCIDVIHQTDQERLTYETGGYTHRCYVAAYGAEPPVRYWIDRGEVDRRLALLDVEHQRIGIRDNGLSHSFRFESMAA